MKNTMKDYIIGTVAVVALVVGVLALWGERQQSPSQEFGAAPTAVVGNLLAENYIPYVLYNGGYQSAKDISTTGSIFGGSMTLSTAASTTLNVTTTSTTQGSCLQWNATSSATKTYFVATTTNAGALTLSLVGLFGTCP